MSAPTRVWMPGPVEVEIHLGADDTGGAFSMLVDQPQPGWALPGHRHAGESETIHVVEGRFETVIEGTRIQSGPGDTAHVPRGALHSGSLIGDAPGRRVLVFAPGGIDRFFREAGAPDPDSLPAPADLLTIAARHGWSFG